MENIYYIRKWAFYVSEKQQNNDDKISESKPLCIFV